MKKSISEIADLVSADRRTVERRAGQLGLVAVPGPKQAKLYDSRELLMLVPPPELSSAAAADDTGTATLEEARIRETVAKADKYELEAKKLRGILAPVDELLEAQNALFDDLGAAVKKSTLSDDEKSDLLDSMIATARRWSEE